MKFSFFILLFTALLFSTQISLAQDSKKVLDNTVYESWKNLENQQISANGNWISFEINPQKGDGTLHLYNAESKFEISFERGTQAFFSADGNFVAFKIVPGYDTLRQLKLKKVKKTKLPKDTLAIYMFDKDTLLKVASIKNFSMSRNGNSWIVYNTYKRKKEYKPKQEDTKSSWLDFLRKKEDPKEKAEKKISFTYVYSPILDKEYEFYNIKKHSFSYDGTQLAFLKESKRDSLNKATIYLFNPINSDSATVFSERGTFGKFSFSRDGQQLAFTFSQDTSAKNKEYNLFYGNLKDSLLKKTVSSDTKGMMKNYSPSAFGSVSFSRDGKRVFFGTAPTPKQEPKDTLLASEKYAVDVWNYKDGRLQPQQLKQLAYERRMSYKAVYFTQTNFIVQLEDSIFSRVRMYKKGNSSLAIASTQRPYEREMSWDGWYQDYYIVNVIGGNRDLILKHHNSTISLSPSEKHVIYYSPKDSAWFAIDLNTNTHTNLTSSMHGLFAKEDHDTPDLPSHNGYYGWSKDKIHFFVRDKYDIWKLDVRGIDKPENITHKFGRMSKVRLTYEPVHYDQKYVDEFDKIYIRGFNEVTKQSGYYSYEFSTGAGPLPLLVSDHFYYSLVKAKNNDRIIWKKMSFQDYPELYTTKSDFSNLRQLSQTNPQKNDYNWGTVELTSWNAFDGTELSGLVYKPENFDSTKNYPMIVYFYEKFTDNFHYHHIPKPSHSTVNFTEYASNGYIVFVPDIVYKTGEPAASAYNCIISGTKHMMKNNWVDSTKMALQGQSWGGYQTAMLVTQTNMFAAAEAGAPVTNMTSAYGGIRWGAGISRAFQYEKGQSRIGTDLWSNRELYIKNSPLFFADKVETPLLIMHNDGDGAVPWYQGIEYFSALRRLDKKVWMLTYNNDEHNLYKWPNRVDLSIRMMQFFNHYLKDAPAPVWMEVGIPAIKKGKVTGYELMK